MMIADAQIHIWAANTPERPWLRKWDKPHRPEPLGMEEILAEMRVAGVDRTVLVPIQAEGDRNDLALEAAAAQPRKFAVMGRLNFEAPDAAAQLASWRSQQGMLGIRVSLNNAEGTRLLSGSTLDWVWREAERSQVPLYVMTMHSDAHFFQKIAQRHPSLKLVLDHLALKTGAKDDEAFRDLDKLLALAQCPNIAVKVSCIPSYTNDQYPFTALHRPLRKVYDAFGPQRMLWGSDMSRLPCTYRQSVTMFTEEMPWLSSSDLDWIMGRSLGAWLGWNW